MILITYLLLLIRTEAWTTTSVSSFRRCQETQLHDSSDEFMYGDSYSPFKLSADDSKRLSQMRERQKECPLLMVESSLLPGQSMEMFSPDCKFLKFVTKLSNEQEMGIVGFHPYKKEQPLSVGVMVDIIDVSMQGETCLLRVEGKERFDIQGQPWWDKKSSCFMANLEICYDEITLNHLSDDNQQQAKEWYDEIPSLTDEWCQLMLSTGRATEFDLEQRCLNQETESFPDRAYAVASLLNPSIPWDSPICLDVRPALLACRSDYDRLHLVYKAIRASLQHVKAAGNSKLL